MKITNELREQIRTLDCEARSKSNEAEIALNASQYFQSEANRLWSIMNFREQALGGLFGGDKTKVKQYRKFMIALVNLDSKASILQYAAKKLNNQIEENIELYLRKNEPNYQLFLQPRNMASIMKKMVDTFIKKIDHALSKIEIAKEIKNYRTDEAIKAVQKVTKLFQEAVNNYSAFLKRHPFPQTNTKIDNSIDLVFDFIFEDKFDFISLFTLSTLGDAESKLKQARAEIIKIDEIVSIHLDKTSKATRAYILSVRVACV